MEKRSIPMLDLKREYLHMKDDIDSAIARCLDHQKWILGPEVYELEDKVARFVGARYCVGTSSGTDALVLSLRALAIKLKGQEYFDRTDHIITTPFTFTATGDAILRAGATPVFVDIDPFTYNIGPARMEEYLSQHSGIGAGGRVIGIIPVHLYGCGCDMGRIMEIAARHGLFVLEDTAQAFGGTWQGKQLGSLGTAGAFSFFPSKNLGAFGDAGMVCTNDNEVAELARMLLKHGGKNKYDVAHLGYNARLDTLQAAVLLAKLDYVNEFNERRRRIAQTYSNGLNGTPGITLPAGPGISAERDSLLEGHVFHQYTLRIANGERDAVQKALQEKGVNTMVYYPVPLHKMKLFGKGRSICGGDLACAEEASSTVLSLPVEPLQTEDETEYVVKTLNTYFSE